MTAAPGARTLATARNIPGDAGLKASIRSVAATLIS